MTPHSLTEYFTETHPISIITRRVCGRSLAGIAGSNPAEVIDVSLVSVMWCQVGLCDEPISRPEESYRLCCVACDIKTSRMRRSWPSLGCCVRERELLAIPITTITLLDCVTGYRLGQTRINLSLTENIVTECYTESLTIHFIGSVNNRQLPTTI
jgi:hypothetical protein